MLQGAKEGKGFESSRGQKYRKANQQAPEVRGNELEVMLEKISPREGERIIDFGCGNGFLTYPLADRVGSEGKIIGVDVSEEMVRSMNGGGRGNVSARVLEDGIIPVEDDSVDCVATLASFHHVGDKENAFREYRRVLKSGGRVVIGDVADDTYVQEFFDGPVDGFCSTGHDFPFLDYDWASYLSEQSGLVLSLWDIEYVPWRFETEEQAGWFIHTLFDATWSEEECLEVAKDILGYKNYEDKFLLNWEFGYLQAEKP